MARRARGCVNIAERLSRVPASPGLRRCPCALPARPPGWSLASEPRVGSRSLAARWPSSLGGGRLAALAVAAPPAVQALGRRAVRPRTALVSGLVTGRCASSGAYCVRGGGGWGGDSRLGRPATVAVGAGAPGRGTGGSSVPPSHVKATARSGGRSAATREGVGVACRLGLAPAVGCVLVARSRAGPCESHQRASTSSLLLGGRPLSRRFDCPTY
jgi:hypothetical protein